MQTTPQTLPRTSSAPISPTTSVHAAYGVRLSQPENVRLYVFTRDHDASVYQLEQHWRVQCNGVTAPIDAQQVDAFAALVNEIETRHVSPAAARRFLALLPGAFIHNL